MLGLSLVLISALYLLVIQKLSRKGLNKNSFTVSEAFILGHWPFLFLNGLILEVTGGREWTSIGLYEAADFATALFVVGAALVCYIMGGNVALKKYRVGISDTSQKSNVWNVRDRDVKVLFIIGIITTILGVYASWVNLDIVQNELLGRGDRSKAMLALSKLLVPGAILLFIVFVTIRKSIFIKWFSLALSIFAAVAITWGWSRTPFLVTIGASYMVYSFLSKGEISRKRIYLLIPFFIAFAVFLLIYRISVTYGISVDDFASNGAILFYMNKLWLDSSAFSAMLIIIKEYGLMNFEGGESFIAPLFFWMPSDIFEFKPRGFFLNQALDVDYTIGPSLYGEAIVNFSVIGLFPLLFVIGYLFKKIDLSFQSKQQSLFALYAYTILMMNVIFLVRGAFYPIVAPILIEIFIPLALLFVLRSIALLKIRQ